ncbi:hypothetical protein HDV03_001923 [Kappamyces sp. JEL0829]|nr:hypothetical protein HDV03_001923 [Kappamyces sp. JEL0829]
MKLLFLSSLVSCLAPLEQPDNSGLYLGVWYDRLNGDTPQDTMQRYAGNPFSFWQADVNITASGFQSQVVDQFVSQVSLVDSKAFLYLTVYPMDGLNVIPDTVVQGFAAKIASIVNRGLKIIIRYASEMNGDWFPYGQQPVAFKREWKRLVDATRAATGPSDSIAWMWSPNSGNGYPFAGGDSHANPTHPDFKELDTNGDGVLNNKDDAYSPYYPGDDYVDWVGISIYHYGNSWPYGSNDIAPSDKFEKIMTGQKDSGFDFYNMFSGNGTKVSAGGKPFFVAETGANTFLSVKSPNGTWYKPTQTDAARRVQVKQGWWRQFINSTLLAKYPKLKAVSLFEFSKYESGSFRDFTNLGGDAGMVPLEWPGQFDAKADNLPTLKAFQADMQGSLGQLVLWGNKVAPSEPTSTLAPAPLPPSTPASSSAASSWLDLGLALAVAVGCL